MVYIPAARSTGLFPILGAHQNTIRVAIAAPALA